VSVASRALAGSLAVLGVVAASCGADDATAGRTGEITVFAAASLTDAFTELGAAFEAAHPDTAARFSFAGSSDLVAQIEAGAPADVFAAADLDTMDRLVASGHAGAPERFATNRLAIITAAGNPEGITAVADLAAPDLVVVTCAAEVPCGAYSQELFANAGVSVTPRSYEENVKGVANKVTLGEADAGIVYTTDVVAAGDRAAGVDIPADVNVVADYPIVATAGAADPEAAAAFVDFVLDPEGQAILADHGFAGP
jgi:molybdate transport system substrate-binding protein